jgi:hypothetical protein
VLFVLVAAVVAAAAAMDAAAVAVADLVGKIILPSFQVIVTLLW